MSDEEYEPYHWQVGDPEDWGDSVGVPDIPYMGYLNGDDGDDDGYRRPPRKTTSRTLHDEAWNLRCQGRYDEALVLINRALEHDDRDFDNWNVKGIILDDKFKFEEAIECYDRALALNPASDVVKNNKAYSLSQIADSEKYRGKDWRKALDAINEALKLMSGDEKRYSYLHIKGNILDSMGKKVDAYVCYLLASNMTDEVREIERKQKIIRNSTETLINITGTYYYRDDVHLDEGAIVELTAEPDNIHDADAIRVEVNGRTAGYVANSPSTLVDGLKSATQIKNVIQPNQKAKVMFRYAQDFIIAKLI